MKNFTENCWKWMAAAALVASLYACAQGARTHEPGRIEWRQFEATVDGRELRFRFPVNTHPQIRLAFNAAPVPDIYTKAIEIIGIQVGLDIGWRMVSTDYSLGLGLSRPRTTEMGQARTVAELDSALNRIAVASASTGRMVFKLSTQRVEKIGGTEWVRSRYIDNDGTGSVAFDDYHGLWSEQYVLRFEVRYGKGLGGDPAEIERVRNLGEGVLASLRIQK